MKRIADMTHRLRRFFSHEIWTLDHDELSKAKARFVKYVKVMLITIKTFANERIGFQAVALSFFSTMAVVPFIALMFSITDGFGLSSILNELIHKYFSDQEIVNTFLSFADNILVSTEKNIYGVTCIFLQNSLILLESSISKICSILEPLYVN